MRGLLAVAVAAVAGSTITLTPRDNGRTVAVRVGDVVVVRLAANPGTGYAWKVTAKPHSLGTVTTRYVPPTSKLLGAPGTFVARAVVARAGRGTLRLVYVRATRPATAPARRFAVVLVAS